MTKVNKYDYTKEDIVHSLRHVGITKGNNIFIHSNIGFFGRLEDADNPDDFYRIFKDAIFSIIGKEGTLVVPTFSYSYCWNRVFDKMNTPGICGFLSEKVRMDPEAIRSDDANFSIAALGKNARYFTEIIPPHSFEENSFWGRFLKENGIICNFNFDSGSTFLHYVEKSLNVDYRYDKKFTGKTITDGKVTESFFYHYVCDHDKPQDMPNFEKFDRLAKQQGISKTADLGKGQIVAISARDTFNFVREQLKTDPRFLLDG